MGETGARSQRNIICAKPQFKQHQPLMKKKVTPTATQELPQCTGYFFWPYVACHGCDGPRFQIVLMGQSTTTIITQIVDIGHMVREVGKKKIILGFMTTCAGRLVLGIFVRRKFVPS